MASLPCLLFNPDGSRHPSPDDAAFPDPDAFREAFFSRIRDDLDDFLGFCAADSADLSYRVYPFAPIGKYRAAFCEKCALPDETLTAVFFAADVTKLHPCLSPSTRYYKSAVNRMLFELLYLRDGGAPNFSTLSPQVFLVVERMPKMAEAIFSRRCGMRLTNLIRLLDVLVESVKEQPTFAGSSLTVNDAGGSLPDIVTSVPVEALVSVLTLLLHVLLAVTPDSALTLSLDVGEDDHGISLSVRTPYAGRIPKGGLAGLYRLPKDLHDAVHMAYVLCALTGMETAVTPDADRLTVTLFPAENTFLEEFKYSDPTAAIAGIVAETAGILGEL